MTKPIGSSDSHIWNRWMDGLRCVGGAMRLHVGAVGDTSAQWLPPANRRMAWLATRAVLVLLAVGFPHRVLACDEDARQRTPILFFSDVSSTVQAADDDVIESTLRDGLKSSGLYRVQLDEQYRDAEQEGTLDPCTPALGVDVSLREETSDPGASAGLGGLVTRSMFIADVTVRQQPQGIVLERFSLQEKMSGLFAGTGNSKAFKRLIANVGVRLTTRRDAMLLAWKPAPPEPVAQVTPPTSGATRANPVKAGTYLPAIPSYKTFDETLDASMSASYAAEVGPEMADNLMAAFRPTLRPISSCMQQRISATETMAVVRFMRMTTLVHEAKLAGKDLDVEAAALAIYGSREASEIGPKMKRGAILFNTSLEYCSEQARIRKARGY